MKMFNISYQSENIIIFSSEEEFKVLSLIDTNNNTKIKTIITWISGFDNSDIELAIFQVLYNTGVDIVEEIQLYRKSQLYNTIEIYNKLD